MKRLLVRGSLVALISPPDIGKTFLALDLVLSIAARQLLWLGQPVQHHGPVFYVIGEGSGRFQLRYVAWKQVHSVTEALPFYWMEQPVPLLDEKAARAFLQQTAPLSPTSYVIDTLSRCFIGGDENSASDMGRAVAACDELRYRTQALILLLHHTKKDGTVERGSSALRGAADTILTLHEDEHQRGLLTLKCERQKDAEPFAPITMRRRTIQLDGVHDDDGEPASSCVIQLATVDERKQSTETKRARIIEVVRQQPGISKTRLATDVGGRRGQTLKDIELIIATGEIRFTPKGLFAADSDLWSNR